MFRGTSLIARIAIALAALAIFASAMSGLLNYLKFDHLVREQERSRYAFMVEDLRGTIEDSLALGLPLATLRNTAGLLLRAKGQDAAVAEITVFDARGLRLYDTDTQRAKQPLDSDWPARLAPNARWSEVNAADSVEGTTIVNAFGQPVGGIALRFTRGESDRLSAQLLFELGQIVLRTGIVATVLALLGCWLVLRPVRRALVADAAGLARLDEPGGRVETARVSALVGSFETESMRVLREIESAERALDGGERSAA